MAEENNSNLAFYHERSFKGEFEARVSIYKAYSAADDVTLYNAFVYFKCKHFEETRLIAGSTDLTKAALVSGYQIREFEVEKERCDERYKRVKIEEEEISN